MEDGVVDAAWDTDSERFARRAQEELASLTPADLLDWIANGDPGDELRRKAIAALHARLETWLEHRARRLREISPGPYVSEADLIGETWLRIIQGAGTYREPPDCGNPIGNLFRWVGTIMRNTLAEVRRSRYWEPLAEIPEDDRDQERELPRPFGQRKIAEPTRPALAHALRCCIKELPSRRQQMVLWASADHFIFCPDRKKMVCEPPAEVRARLAEELGTTDNNICKLRERAMKRVRACVTTKTGLES